MNKKKNQALIGCLFSVFIGMFSLAALEAQMGGSTTGMVFPEIGVLFALLRLVVSGIGILVFSIFLLKN